MHTYLKKPYLTFKQSEIIFQNGRGDFVIELSDEAQKLDASLVLDCYDLNNPVHPEGHFAWSKFSLKDIKKMAHGNLSSENNHLIIALDNHIAESSWKTENDLHSTQLRLTAVLRDNTTNKIIYLENLPVFKNKKDFDSFRNRFLFDGASPCFTKSWFLPKRDTTIRIVSHHIHPEDGVGNFCLNLYKLFQQNYFSVALYAEHFDLSMNTIIKRESSLFSDVNENENDILFYHYSIYDPLLESLLKLPFKNKIVYFHGITNPKHSRVFDFELSMLCEKAIEQTALLSHFDQVATNSGESAKMLAHYNTHIKNDTIEIIPPLLLPESKNKRTNQKNINPTEIKKFLYVGQFKAHKKIEDILAFFKSYLELETTAELWLVGHTDNKPYMDYLKWAENNVLAEKKSQVKWLHTVDDNTLQSIYNHATAYIAMSEDEGFCIPLFEAMSAGLPVFAYGINTVKETLGGSGIYFEEKNFDFIAQKAHQILNDAQYKLDIVEKQHNQVKTLSKKIKGEKILSLIEKTI
jgi:glycosyltransferase involved in cell wall biosynthesis